AWRDKVASRGGVDKPPGHRSRQPSRKGQRGPSPTPPPLPLPFEQYVASGAHEMRQRQRFADGPCPRRHALEREHESRQEHRWQVIVLLFGLYDVSKARLDLALRPSGQCLAVSKDTRGISRLVKLRVSIQPECVPIEATGGYELKLLERLL